MKRKLHTSLCNSVLAVSFLIGSSLTVSAQRTLKKSYFEAGISAGPSNFLGDLGGNYGRGTTFLKDNNTELTKLMLSAYVAYHPNAWLGIRLAVNKGKLEGDDGIINGRGGLEEARKLRNSNFRSDLKEAYVAAEIYPFNALSSRLTDMFFRVQPYGILGVGVFHFNPQGQDPTTGEWVDLKPLRTEGQGFPEYPDRKEYNLTQVNIPMGFGVKYLVSERVDFSFEVLHRKTFTDYIDDVSTTYIDPAIYYSRLPAEVAQRAERLSNKTSLSGLSLSLFGPGSKRGTSANNDAYYACVMKLSIRLGKGSVDSRWNKSMRCPVRY